MIYPLNILLLGTAGAGKSSLVKTFGEWIEQNTDRGIAYVNLDPGCERVPFKPDFDVRKYFTLSQLMHEYGLGPNGAMVRAAELFHQRAVEFSRRMREAGGDIRLIDTPGQLEVFLFHGGPEFIEAMDGTTVSLFLMDAEVVKEPAGMVLTRLLGLSTWLRLGTPVVCVLNKIDLMGDRGPEVDEILTGKLSEHELKDGGVGAELTLKLSEVLVQLLPPARVVRTSAKTGAGMRELYDVVHEVFCTCGDLT